MTIKVTPQVIDALREARARKGSSTSPLLLAALEALRSADLAAAREVAALPDGPSIMVRATRTSRKPKPLQRDRDLFVPD